MSGQCYRCTASFGFLKKEVGCKHCGYSFCKDCLKKKIEVPKLNNEKHKVCDKCFKILSGAAPAPTAARYSPPAAYKKRIAALENPEVAKSTQPAPVNIKNDTKKYRGMSAEDIAIAQRLENLKESRRKDQPPVPTQREMEDRLSKLKKKEGPPPPSEREMAERLAKLKGQDPSKASTPNVLRPDNRSQQKQIDDLLEEICDEVTIDSGTNPMDGAVNSQLSDPSLTKDEKAEQDADVAKMIQQVAREMELDAEKAIEGLKKDKEIWERLQNLQDKKGKEAVGDNEEPDKDEKDESESEDEEESAKRLIKQFMLESKLDDKCGYSGSKPKPSLPQPSSDSAFSDVCEYTDDPEELPWCCMCNEDADVRCLGCDNDLYCRRCFKEGHDRQDYEDHKTKPYPSRSK